MRKEKLRGIAFDLLSVPPFITRCLRRRLVKHTFGEIMKKFTPLHMEIIRLLEEEGSLYIGEIGEKLQIASAQMTKLIDKLVDMKLVERKPALNDRRAINIALTDYGNTVLEENKVVLANAMLDTMTDLTEEDLENLSHSLENVRQILSKLQ